MKMRPNNNQQFRVITVSFSSSKDNKCTLGKGRKYSVFVEDMQIQIIDPVAVVTHTFWHLYNCIHDSLLFLNKSWQLTGRGEKKIKEEKDEEVNVLQLAVIWIALH